MEDSVTINYVFLRNVKTLFNYGASPSCDHSRCDRRLALFPKVFHCVACEANYCEGCWKVVEPHKKQKSSTNHRESDPRLADLLSGILKPPTRSKGQQQKLHQEDARSLWFGVSEEDGKKFIHEGSVYEDLIFENPAVQPWGIYPGLVTFVGDRYDIITAYKVKQND